jgi:hypothetical protein
VRNSLGALQAAWDDNGVVFSLIKSYYSILNEPLMFRKMGRKNKAYGIIG